MIESRDLTKEFGSPPQRVLHSINLRIDDGEFVSISGKSGSGKSTLLYLLSTLDLPSFGEIRIDGCNLAAMSTEEVHAFRNLHVGFIFQFHYLLAELTAMENILLPARNLGVMKEKEPRARELLERLGIAKKEKSFPWQMSGGEQQRVAIARALILSPKYLFADEPSGNLDTENTQVVMDMLTEVHSIGTTICLVTHDPDFAAIAKRNIHLVDGRLK